MAVLSDGPTSFRRAGPGDVAALVDLVESAYRGDRSRRGWSSEADLLGGQRVDAAMMEATLSSPDALVLVLEDGDGRPLACCELRRPDDDGTDGAVASFGMFAVDPERQTGGLGRRVLAEAERVVVEEWGLDRLRMTVIEQRTELIDWYRRRGYEPTGETEPFPYGDERYGRPRRDDLRFVVLERDLRRAP